MTETMEPGRGRSDGLDPDVSPLAALKSFDLIDDIGVRLGRFAGVEPPMRLERAPRVDGAFIWRVAGRVVRDPTKRRALLTFVAAVAVFSAAVFMLLSVGALGAAYEVLWTWFPGRPWTHVMRDHPWLYLAIAAPLGFVPFVLAPDVRWGRAFLTYIFFLLGFLGGHVFW